MFFYSCSVIRDYCISGRLRNAESVLYFMNTIRESGRNLLAYRVRGGHYPRPDAIRCDNGRFGAEETTTAHQRRGARRQEAYTTPP